MVGVSGIDPDLEQPSAAKGLIRPSRALHLRPEMATLRGYDPRPSRRQREILPLNYRAYIRAPVVRSTYIRQPRCWHFDAYRAL